MLVLHKLLCGELEAVFGEGFPERNTAGDERRIRLFRKKILIVFYIKNWILLKF